MGSVLELRPKFAPGMITALIRMEGHPFGLIANNPMFLAGAIDAPCADKAARVPSALRRVRSQHRFALRHAGVHGNGGRGELGLACAANLTHVRSQRHDAKAAMFTVVLRKGYGLGAQAMAGGSFHAPFFIVSWPTGEFGGMGLEGAVRLGSARFEGEPTLDAREALFKREGRAVLCARQGDQHGGLSGDRRRHRSGGHAALADARAEIPAAAPQRYAEAFSRYVVAKVREACADDRNSQVSSSRCGDRRGFRAR